MDYSQELEYQSSGDDYYDTPMYLTNQALFKRQYTLDTAQEDDNKWQVYLNLLHTVVEEGLGDTVIEYLINEAILSSYFTTSTTDPINEHFVPNNHVTAI